MKNKTQESTVGRGYFLSEEKLLHKPVPDNGGPPRVLSEEELLKILESAAKNAPKFNPI